MSRRCSLELYSTRHATPAFADTSAAQFQSLPLFFRVLAMQKAARKRAINDQVAQAFGMAARISDGNCAALGYAEGSDQARATRGRR